MLRLFKYLKPYTLLILIAVALLFVQANSDLALPDYMSKIVNNGIQQGGIEIPVPIAIRQTEMNKVLIFLSAYGKALVLGDYTLVDKTSPDYNTYVKQYPVLANEPIYILKSIDTAETDKLKPVMSKYLIIVSFIQQVMTDPTKAAVMGQGLGFDLSKIPAGLDIFSLLGKLPPSQLSTITSAINQKFNTLGDSMITQMAVG
jgi:ATP-binding cassette subfamily B multidrug efflux pump